MRNSIHLQAGAAAFAAGAAVALHFQPGRIPLAVGFLAVVLAGGGGSAVVAFAAAGFVVAGASRAPVAPGLVAAGPASLRGEVAGMPRRDGERVRMLIDDPDGTRVEVSAPDLPAPVAPGDRLLVSAEFREPRPAGNPGGRDGVALAAAHGIVAHATSRVPPARTAPPGPLSRVAAARVDFARQVERALPPREGALVRAIGAGDEAGIDAATRERFARSGLAHVLSVSGLHLAVVALGAWGALRALLVRVRPLASRVDARRVAAAACLPVTALYAVATGASVPVLRSALGAGLLFAGVLLGRGSDARQSLALAALALLSLDPGALLDVSFQLSFASVAGLVALSGPIRAAIPVRPDRSRWPGRLLEGALAAASASAAATLATAPLLALHFRSLSLVGLPANLVALPLASALTVAAALAYLASAVAPFLAPVLFLACRPLAWGFLALNDAFARPSLAAVGVASPGWGGVAVAFALGAAALHAAGRRRALLAVGAALAVLLPGPVRLAAARLRPGIEVVFLSVGQGDCTVVRLPDGSAVVVDAGGDLTGRYDPGARDVLPFLRDMGVVRLAAAVVSHPHPDHLLGLPAVVAGMHGSLLLGNHERGDAAAQDAFARLPPVRELADGDAFTLSGVRFQVLGPPRGDRRLTENDASVVLLVTYGETSFLLPGDVEAAGEAALVARGVPRVDVVKAPHHGSRTSSGRGLVGATRPRWVVFPVGAGNRYGFPHDETVDRWREVGAIPLRTDEGAVRFRSDGRSVWRAEPGAALDAWELVRGR